MIEIFRNNLSRTWGKVGMISFFHLMNNDFQSKAPTELLVNNIDLIVKFSDVNIRIRYSDWSRNSAYDVIITSREVIIELMARLLS